MDLDYGTMYMIVTVVVSLAIYAIWKVVASIINIGYLRCPRCTQVLQTIGEVKDVSCPMCGTKIVENGVFASQSEK